MSEKLSSEQQRLILEFARTESSRKGEVDGLDEYLAELEAAEARASDAGPNGGIAEDPSSGGDSGSSGGIFSAISGMFDSGGVDADADARAKKDKATANFKGTPTSNGDGANGDESGPKSESK
jgi:hypothetical protein